MSTPFGFTPWSAHSPTSIRTCEEIEVWLVCHIAHALNISAEEVDVRQPFSHYGFGSVEALGLAGALEDWLGRDLPSTLAWDYPNIESLAKYLAA
jgi:acyl carrier protein